MRACSSTASYYCHHHPDFTGPCDCRKPAPGLLLRAADELGLELSESWMIGDADTDVAAAHAAGAQAVLVAHPRTAHRRSGAVRRPHRPRPGRGGGPDRLVNVKLFADGADLEHILRLAADERIRGFTTNPTLMWKAGLTDYSEFCHRLLAEITDRPISFEVFADDPDEIRRQARTLAGWGANVYVKVPVTTTRGESLGRGRARPRAPTASRST